MGFQHSSGGQGEGENLREVGKGFVIDVYIKNLDIL